MHKLLLILFCSTLTSLACVNSSYSRLDERKITNQLIHLILGQFSHRSSAFYEFKLKESRTKLLAEPTNYLARNDLAVSYIKLERWQEAEHELLKNEELHPGKYETASNFGVLYKKWGKYPKAAEFLEKSFTIKEGGHMGLGDYYLLMCRDLAEPNYNKNFLGVDYDAPPQVAAKIANKEHIISLIKNDYLYSDSYYVLGDILYTESEYQLAAHAYVRAYSLGSSADIRARLQLIVDHWKANKAFFQVVDPVNIILQSIRTRINKAEDWLAQFKKAETDMIAKHNKTHTFNEIIWEMENQGILRSPVPEAGIYIGFQFNPVIAFITLLGLGIIILKIVYDFRKRNKTTAQ